MQDQAEGEAVASRVVVAPPAASREGRARAAAPVVQALAPTAALALDSDLWAGLAAQLWVTLAAAIEAAALWAAF